MSHPLHHAAVSAKVWGGVIDDYLPVHNWLDATKELFADFRHRALRHHSHGIFEAERIFGSAIVNSHGKSVPVRYICEQHILEDCGGKIPTVSDWLREIKPQAWMSRGYRVKGQEDDKAPTPPAVKSTAPHQPA
jgi:hypothetical protein